MLKLHNLEPLKKKRKRVGRGGSRGGTSGRGHKGQRARSGGPSELKPSFEGGQMPLSRRLPRRGFTNIFKKEYKIISLSDLEKRFDVGATVSYEVLREKGFVKGRKRLPIKILSGKADFELTKQLTIHADSWSKSAEEMIKKAGGTIRREAEEGGYQGGDRGIAS
jgi:large subunit ribosomal protein L15